MRKFRFILQEHIWLGDKILAKEIKVDRKKVDVIEKLPSHVNVKLYDQND